MDIVVTNVTSKLLSRKRDLNVKKKKSRSRNESQLTKLKDGNNPLSA